MTLKDEVLIYVPLAIINIYSTVRSLEPRQTPADVRTYIKEVSLFVVHITISESHHWKDWSQK